MFLSYIRLALLNLSGNRLPLGKFLLVHWKILQDNKSLVRTKHTQFQGLCVGSSGLLYSFGILFRMQVLKRKQEQETICL